MAWNEEHPGTWGKEQQYGEMESSLTANSEGGLRRADVHWLLATSSYQDHLLFTFHFFPSGPEAVTTKKAKESRHSN